MPTTAPPATAFWQELDALRQSISQLAAGFHARSLTPSSAESVVRACAQMEASISSMKRLAAARAAEGTGWKHEGYRSPAEQLAHQTGMSPGAARRAIDTGRRMADQPEVAQAALAGDLSPEQAAAVADGAAADPAGTRDLLAKAQRMSVSELHEEVARTRAAATDDEARRRRIRANRHLKRWTDPEGALQARLYGLPEDGTVLWRALDPIRRRLIMLRRQTGDPNEALMALDYDALMTLAAAAVGVESELGIDELVGLDLFPGLATADPPVRSSGPSGSSPPPPSPPPGGPTAAPMPSPPATPRLIPAPPPPATSAPSVPRPDDLFSTLDQTGHAEGSESPELAASGPATSGPATSEPTRSAHASKGAGPPKRLKKLAGSPAQVIVRVDLDTLLRGCRVGNEVCEIDGWGPIDVSYIHALINSGQAQLAAILTRQKKISGVYLDRRRPNAWQKTAINFTYSTCAVEGCNARSGLEYEHRIPHSETGYTLLELLDRLCPHHHKLKTHHGWSLVEGVGKRPFVPSDDPRHPDFAKRPGGSRDDGAVP